MKRKKARKAPSMNCSNEQAGFLWHELNPSTDLSHCVTCGTKIGKCCQQYLKTGLHPGRSPNLLGLSFSLALAKSGCIGHPVSLLRSGPSIRQRRAVQELKAIWK